MLNLLLPDQGKESDAKCNSEMKRCLEEELLKCLFLRHILVGHVLLFRKLHVPEEGRSVSEYRSLHTNCSVTLGIDSDLLECFLH